MKKLLVIGVCVIATMQPGRAQKSAVETARSQPTSRPTAVTDPIARPLTVQIVGASVSAGFVDLLGSTTGRANGSIKLKDAMQALWPPAASKITDAASSFVFLNPIELAKGQLRRALRHGQPDLVLAIDFMFWFGYGRLKGDFGDEAAARTKLQDQGFELLAQFQCPVLLGDLPDMRGADPRMLPLAAVPSPKVLQLLNKRILQWASTRRNVRLFPLSTFVDEIKNKTFAFEFEGRKYDLSAGQLMQSDRLHASRLGVAVLTHRLGDSLRELFGKDHVLGKVDYSMPAVIKKLRLVDELPKPH